MDDKNLHNEYFYGDKLPVNIPSPDDAWNDMRKRLKKEKKRGIPWWIAFFLTIGLLLLSLFIINILKQHNTVSNPLSENLSPGKTAESNNKKNVQGDHLEHDGEKPAADAKDIKTKSGKTSAQNRLLAGEKREVIYEDKGAVYLHRNEKKVRLKIGSRESSSGSDVKDTTAIHDQDNVVAGINNLLPADEQTDLPEGKKDGKDTMANDINEKPAIKNKRPAADSANEDNEEEKIQDEEKDYTTDAGLQWNAQLPFANAPGFFSGPDANSQPYRLLLPGVWISMHTERSLLMVEVNPFSTVHVPDKPFKISTFSTTASDTSITTSVIKNLNKLFGFSAGLGYAYNVAGNWWLGGKLQANWWSKGIATSRIDIRKESLSSSFNTIDTHSFNKYSLGENDWNDFERFQMKISAEILYRKKIWHAGLHAGIPVMPFSKSAGPATPFSTELFFRLQLWTDNKSN